jgi:hypothetical protein
MSQFRGKYRRILSNRLFFVGFLGALLTNGTSFALMFYFSIARPVTARPELRWIVRLPWAKTYGTVEESRAMYGLHMSGIAFALLCFSGWALWNWRAIRAELKSEGLERSSYRNPPFR